MLQFLIGSAGAGKSTDCYRRVIEESLKNPNKNYIILVPEQFTLQTQKELVMMHPRKGIMNIDVLSFLRLAFRVFEEVGTKQCMVLEDMGKSLIVKRVLLEKKSELAYFSSSVEKQGFSEEMKSVLSEFFQYSIDAGRIGRMKEAAQGKPVLLKKLNDIELVYNGFCDFLKEKYITAEEIYDLLSREIAKSRILKDSVIVLDSFTGFTPSQYHLLEALMKYADKVYVTVTMNRRESERVQKEHQLFYLSAKTIEKLRQLAANVNCEVEEPVLLPEGQEDVPYRYRNKPALCALEERIFRYPVKPYEEETEEIRLWQSAGPATEARAAVCEIKRLLRKGMRYRDIAIVCADTEIYGKLLMREFDRAGIPGFLDHKKNILTNPLVELIRALLELSEGNYGFEQIFRWAKSGLSELTRDECDLLENYVLAVGIKGKSMWTKPWTGTVRGMYACDPEYLNTLREKVTDALFPVLEVLSDSKRTTAERVAALRTYLESHATEERLIALAEELKQYETQDLAVQRKNRLLIKEYEQVCKIVEEIMQRAEELLGEERLSAREFREIMETGFREAKVGLVPPGIDQVVIGDVERTRLKDIKVLFFLGVNEGLVPSVKDGGGILSDSDRGFFAQAGIELSPTKRQASYTSEFYLYLNLTKPKETLYISYAENSAGMEKLRPSYLVGRIKTLFPKLKVSIPELEKDAESVLGSDGGREYLIRQMQKFREGKADSLLPGLLALGVMDSDEAKKTAEMVFYRSKLQKISEQNAKRLYGEKLIGSVTRMEQYASCALAHFLNYGLHLKERPEYKLTMPDIGTVFHTALELFAEKLKESGQNWRSLPEEEQIRLAGECTAQAAADYGNGILISTKRNEYILRRVERIMRRTLKTVQQQLGHGMFEPAYFEEEFTYKNGYMELKGRIDRIDTCFQEDNCYIRVTDYKSGNISFDLNKVLYGLQMQLGVYLGAAIKKMQREFPQLTMVPAGILYYRLGDPVVAKSDTVPEDILKELRPKGLVNSEGKILKLMDRRLIPPEEGEQEEAANPDRLRESFVSDSIPVETKKDGTIGRYSGTAGTTALMSLGGYLDALMEEYGKEILSGEASANPYRYKGTTPCSYCAYRDLCAFEELSGKKCRNLRGQSQEEIWEEIGQKSKEK